MSPELEALMRAILADPAKLAALTPDQERVVIASLRAAAVPSTEAAPAVSPTPSYDDLLTAEEVATLLKTSVRFVYRHACSWPFARRISRKCLRFDRQGLMRYVAKKGL